MKDGLLKFGLGGSVIAALCCLTPILSGLLALAGFAALVGYLDIVLFPALIFFLTLTGYALWRRRQIK